MACDPSCYIVSNNEVVTGMSYHLILTALIIFTVLDNKPIMCVEICIWLNHIDLLVTNTAKTLSSFDT